MTDLVDDGLLPHIRLEEARDRVGMSVENLWWDYFALGGSAFPEEAHAMLAGEPLVSRREYDVFVQALNERLIELGLDDPVPYSDELQ